MAIRGKNQDAEKWDKVYTPGEDTSTVEVSCQVGNKEDQVDTICDTFELGVISQIEFEMYDVVIVLSARSVDSDMSRTDLASLNFRIKHYNPDVIYWVMEAKVFMFFVTFAFLVIFLYSVYAATAGVRATISSEFLAVE